ncbi:MAG: beta/gamma crystallin family protein [Proteobacteria bacterium]|nr:beta/gamma crystallin family protein [Pseudomonadota bacterium]
MKRFASACLLAMGALSLFATSDASARPRRASIIVYQEDNFRGASREFRDDQEDLGWVHFDDRISSIEVHGGVWELCEHSRFRGRCITVDHDVRKLGRMGMDDRISSIRRIR